MCGIVAVYHHRTEAGPVDRERLARAAEAMRARGPDGKGLWLSKDERTGLAHRRLAVIDPLKRSDQPMLLPGRGLRIVFNGEIYNHAALRAELQTLGVAFATASDTEVLLQLYAREGEAMLSRLRGMFAFCIWDEGRGELFCARDPLGIKPLYLAEDAQGVALASQVKALLAGGGVDARPDPAGHVGFFLLGSVPEPHTLYRGIRAFPPGSWMRFAADGRREQGTYFDLRRRLSETPPAGQPLPPAQLAGWLEESLALHRVADVPQLFFLSAGRDSATLAALAAQAGEAADSLTLGFDHPSVTDERAPARRLAQSLNCRHRDALLEKDEFLAGMDDLLAAMDQPSIDGVNVYWTARAAAHVSAQPGYKVAISGLGGDELFGGYPSFRQIPRLLGVGRVPGLVSLGAALRPLLSLLFARVGSPKYAGLLEYAGGAGDAWLLRRALYMPWELPRELHALLGPDGVAEGLAELDLRRRLAGDCVPSVHASIVALETGWYMRNQLLRDADWAGMAHGVEIRVPLVDAQLLERLAPWLVGMHPPDKAMMASAPRQPLPAEILHRPKTGFGTPLQAWSPGGGGERGDRGWARSVYRAFAG